MQDFLRNQSHAGSKRMILAIVLTPALSLLAFWMGGETALVFVALLLPMVVAVNFLWPSHRLANSLQSAQNDLLSEPAFDALVRSTVEDAQLSGSKTAVFVLEIDDFDEMLNHHGSAAMDNVREQMRLRIRSGLRTPDIVGGIDQKTFAICLQPQKSIDLEACLELAGRITRALTEPYSVDQTSIYLTASMGFCQSGRETSKELNSKRHPVFTCARSALAQALAAAPSAIRAYTPDTNPAYDAPAHNQLNAVDGLDNGEILPWFQPQISTDTGQITGFEALARWMHPERGAIAPDQFLRQLEDAGRLGRLSEVIIYHALTALKAWDQAGLKIQQVGVNFSPSELNDPHLVEKITWELDRFELTPDRLAVEILETVVSRGPDDVVTRNIKGLGALGCRIDLDDFGTGHASLASIRRFGVGRIKIDRSFVMRADRDAEQQRMIKAILTLAEKLDLETVAEGVETVGEHSLLAQLGCTHVQGYGIARPMPFEQTLKWISEHNSKLQAPPNIGRIAR